MASLFKEPYRILVRLQRGWENLLALTGSFAFFKKTRKDEYPITFGIWYRQKFLGRNAAAYWPMHTASLVSYAQRVLIGKGVVPGYSPGCFIHGVNRIYIGDYTFIAPNVGIMSGNHDLGDMRRQTENKPIRIGKYCWLGMGVVVLPEVELGDYTIVGAGAVVTKSFPEGYCVIGGNPAKIIRMLDKETCNHYEDEYAYIGYIPSGKFEQFKKEKLDV